MKAATPSPRHSLGKQDDLHRLTALSNFRPNIEATMDAFYHHFINNCVKSLFFVKLFS